MTRTFTAVLLTAAFVAGPMAFAEDAMPLRELPPLVVERVKKEHPAAQLVAAAKEERNDYVHYFVKISTDGSLRRLEVLENGTLVAELPAK